MRIPETLQAALSAADEAYLIGLSNKGTVNRGKKDLAALTAPEWTVEGESVRITLGEVSCQIKAPLGDSTCTCPSSGMCRHRIAAILFLKNQAPTAEPVEVTFDSLKACSVDQIRKTLGNKRLAAALAHWENGVRMEESTVVNVEMSWHPATVRLVEPLEHSTCTCHSKTFCIHKAEAVLYWQLSHSLLNPANLVIQPESELDAEAVRAVCKAVREELRDQLTTGLSRMPRSVCDTVERLAGLSHTAGLANLERALRSLHGEYEAYFTRSATFRDTALLARISQAFRLASALEQADEDRMQKLAGTFRDDYQPAGNLRLYLMGLREFAGRSGYAGTIYYFYQEKNGEFCTFTHVRPTFYDGKPRQKDISPWNLPCTLRQVWNHEIDLKGAKMSRSGNLSATEQCQATLLPGKAPGTIFPASQIVTDFGKLLEQAKPNAPELSRLAVIRPAGWEKLPYDRVRQVLTLRLCDGQNRSLWLEVAYKKEEAPVVEALERLSPKDDLVFFGIVYREEDQLKCYPIEYFTDWEGEP